MRAFPLAARVAVVCGLLVLASAPAVTADENTVAALQVKLVESRMKLNDLYARSAAAAERLNGATFELEEAQADLDRQKAEVERAEARLADQREAVAALTLDQLQSGTASSRLTTLMESGGPQQLLERAGAYSSTSEAMNARVDALTARQVVHDAAVQRADAAQKSLRQAVRNRTAAAASIDRAIAEAEAAEEATKRERTDLLRRLAAAQEVTVEEATREQAQIDRTIDRSGPSTPVGGPVDAGPEPEPQPEPPSSEPAPEPTPKPKPKPKPDPPPADPPAPSGSKVDKAIAFARAQLGEKYKWGGAGPSSWDCSGLVMKAWGAAGVSLPHSGSGQYTRTSRVSVGSIKRGDLLFWSKGSAKSIYHVAMYLGGGKMIHAPRPGRSVEIVSITYWIKPNLASRPG